MTTPEARGKPVPMAAGLRVLWTGGNGNMSGSTSIDVVAKYDAANGDTQASATAEAARAQATQAADGAFATSGANLSNQPATAMWSDSTITWSFAAGPSSSASPFSSAIGVQEQSVVEQALQTWATASGVTFQQVSDSAEPDISIGWGSFNTEKSSVVGYTTNQQSGSWMLPGSAVLLEDPNETSLVGDANGQLTYDGTDVTLYQAALHKIGHALGLADDSDPNSVMYPTLGSAHTTLDGTDIAAIQNLYGPEGTASVFFPNTASFAAQAAAASLITAAAHVPVLSANLPN